MSDALVISDLHIGGYVTRTKDVLSFLVGLPETDLLILNGDILDASVIAIPDAEMIIFDHLAGMRVKKVWNKGNHDPKPHDWAELIGAEVHEEVVVESGGKKFLVLHGHQFDPYVNTKGFFHGFGAWCARSIGRMGWRWLARQLRYSTSRHAINLVENGARDRCRHRGCDGVICGHTHQPIASGDGIYVNEGSWCENIGPTYAIIEDGEIKLMGA